MAGNKKKFSTDVPVLIYGAGQKGEVYFEVLKKRGNPVIGFLDKNADDIKMLKGISVYKPDDERISQETKTESVVIITILNVFEHDNIAKSLYQMGYSYIVFKSNLLLGGNENSSKINYIYDAIYPYENCANDLEIPCFEQISDKTVKNLDVLAQDEDFVVAMVPAEILFTLNDDYFSEYSVKNNPDLKLSNQSVFLYLYCAKLYKMFDGKLSLNQSKEYLNWYMNFAFFYDTYSNSTVRYNNFKRHLNERYKIYSYMSYALANNPNFFRENPPYVIWNEKKAVFYIYEGKNRTAFLLGREQFDIPCKMSKSDYLKWINCASIEREKEVIEKANIRMHFAHPANRIFKNNFFYRQFDRIKLLSICEYLSEKNYSFDGKTVLDLEAGSGYFGQFFSKLGAEVFYMEEKEDEKSQIRALNNIVYCKATFLYDINSSCFDFVMCPQDKLNIMEKIKVNDYIVLDIDNNLSPEVSKYQYNVIKCLAINECIHEIALVEFA